METPSKSGLGIPSESHITTVRRALTGAAVWISGASGYAVNGSAGPFLESR